MASQITALTAAQRLDSRGKPTVQVVLTTELGRFTALVPSGASKGDYEAIELRDGDKAIYDGNGVSQAVDNVRKVLGPELIAKGFDVATQQAEIDFFMCELDGRKDKGHLGANAILGISMAVARAGAAARVRFPCLLRVELTLDRDCHYTNTLPLLRAERLTNLVCLFRSSMS